MKNFNEKGIAIYLALVITAILLSIGLGLSAILVPQLKAIKGQERSVFALCAADTGIERELYERNLAGTAYFGYLDLNKNEVQDDDDSAYTVTVIAGGENNCPVDAHFCIKSIGIYKNAQRAIQVAR